MYAFYDAESIRLRCLLVGFTISVSTAWHIASLVAEVSQ